MTGFVTLSPRVPLWDPRVAAAPTGSAALCQRSQPETRSPRTIWANDFAGVTWMPGLQGRKWVVTQVTRVTGARESWM